MDLAKKGWDVLISDFYSVLSEVQNRLEVLCTNLLHSLLEKCRWMVCTWFQFIVPVTQPSFVFVTRGRQNEQMSHGNLCFGIPEAEISHIQLGGSWSRDQASSVWPRGAWWIFLKLLWVSFLLFSASFACNEVFHDSCFAGVLWVLSVIWPSIVAAASLVCWALVPGNFLSWHWNWRVLGCFIWEGSQGFGTGICFLWMRRWSRGDPTYISWRRESSRNPTWRCELPIITKQVILRGKECYL